MPTQTSAVMADVFFAPVFMLPHRVAVVGLEQRENENGNESGIDSEKAMRTKLMQLLSTCQGRMMHHAIPCGGTK